MRGYFIFCILSFVLLARVGAQEAVLGKVTANQLNVRVLPGVSYTAVAKLAKDAEVKVHRARDGWCEIEAPGDSAVWMASAEIGVDGIVSKDSFLRSGPDVTYSPYSRRAAKGEKLSVLERRSDWTRVAPPAGLRAWASLDFITLPEEDLRKLKESGEGDAAKPAKGGLDLDFVPLPEKDASYEGFLVLVKNSDSVKHALVLDVNGSLAPICYLHSEKDNLDLWLNQKVRVSGKENWVKDWKRPLIIVGKIEKSSAEVNIH